MSFTEESPVSQGDQTPLHALVELAGMSLDELTADSALEHIVRATLSTVPGAAEVSITMMAGDEPKTVAMTGRLALDLDERQYAHGYGPCVDAARGGEMMHVKDMRSEPRWPDYAAEAVGCGVLSSMSAPLPERGSVTGALNVYATEADAFDDRSCELARTFASYAAAALSNVQLYGTAKREAEALQRAMQSRAVIEQAKGVLMAERRCSAEEAFDILVRLSQETNVKLRDVASAVVYRASGGQ